MISISHNNTRTPKQAYRNVDRGSVVAAKHLILKGIERCYGCYWKAIPCLFGVLVSVIVVLEVLK